MRIEPAGLAKLSRPVSHRAVARERLFVLMDKHRKERRAICVVGPPGAGKTTLVGSWLNARRAPGIWYQVDSGDADLPTFFYYLALSATPFTERRRNSLPLLLPEYFRDVPGFARRFFRDFFALLPAGAIVVFDNYQEVAVGEAFHEIVALAVNEAPPGILIVVISRRDPPACYARLLANEAVALVDSEKLKLDPDEMDAIARQHGVTAPEMLSKLREVTDGWAAGLVLAVEGDTSKVDAAAVIDSTRDATFNYFAAEIFDRVPPSTQRFLMLTALLPDVPVSLAERLTGDPRSRAILEDLHHRHLFTHRKHAKHIEGSEAAYSYHALFRSFLTAQARQRLTAEEQGEARRRAAGLLEECNPETALDMYFDARDWRAAERLIVKSAKAMIDQGRWKAVAEQVSRIPAQHVDDSQWLSCWLGMALAATAPADARRHFERSFVVAKERSDAACQARAASGVIRTYLLEYDSFQPLDYWAETLQDVISRTQFESADAEIMAHSSVVTAFGFRQLGRPELECSALRVLELLPAVSDVNLQLSAVASILAWGSLTGPLDMAHRVSPIAAALWRMPEVTPLNAAVAGYLIAWYHCLVRNRKECEQTLRVLEEIHERNGLPIASAYAATIGAVLELYDGRIEPATRWCDLLARTADNRRGFDRAMLDGMKGRLSLLRGEAAAALEYDQRALEVRTALGSAFHQIQSHQSLIWDNIELGAFEEAGRLVDENRELIRAFGAGRFALDLPVAEAYIALRRGQRNECQHRLREAFRLSRTQSLDHMWSKLRHWMPPLCMVALEADIECDYVRNLIKHFDWPVPTERPEAWPWLVRVYAFGALRVVVDDVPLKFSRKTPRKPLALLRAILAFGASDVPTSRCIDDLWPDDDGDSAYHSFGLALHRLRKLLGGVETILLEQGKLSLNRHLVWTDVGAFGSAVAIALDTGDLEPVLRIYTGDFLADGEAYPWAVPVRERFRRSFVHCASELARRKESTGQIDIAIDWYRRARGLAPLGEEFTQGLMRCHIARGERLEAATALEELKTRLHTEQGTAPASATLAVARNLSIDRVN